MISSSSQKKDTDKRLLLTLYFTRLYSVRGIFSVLVNYISISVVQKTQKEHGTVLIINQEKSMIKCKCLKIAMQLFTFCLLYGFVFDLLLGYIPVMVNIKWVEDIVCLHKSAASLQEENWCVSNTGLLLSRISLFPSNTCYSLCISI